MAILLMSSLFTFGIAFASTVAPYSSLRATAGSCSHLLTLSALFRPKVDDISLLAVNTSYFSLVLEFSKGRLQNLYWNRDGCASCSGKSNFFCLNKQDSAIKTNNCKNHQGSVDFSLGIELAFSGTDKHLSALNSWYEVENLRQYSLYVLYSNLRDSLTSQYNKIL